MYDAGSVLLQARSTFCRTVKVAGATAAWYGMSESEMDKVLKLRRYGRKDYTLLVDFPVEIVGRDGVVRRYSFEESIRLYQRRIASAPNRYTDMDVAEAEVAHCRRRIEQLRRSYFARYGWFEIHTPPGARPVEEGLAGEVAAFLRRCAEGTDLDPETLKITLLGEGDPHIFYVERSGEAEALSGPFLLYLYRFADGQEGSSREAFFGFLKILQGVRQVAEGVETLVAFHHTADCGLVLTGQPGDLSEAARAAGMMNLPPLDGLFQDEGRSEDPSRDASLLLRSGRKREALEAFLTIYQQNPWRRTAAVSAAAAADALGLFRDAETVAVMASRYFPDDPDVAYQLALSRLRTGDVAGAEEALAELHTTWPLRLMGALISLRAGKPLPALLRLARLGRPEAVERELVGAARWAWRRLLLWVSLRAVAGAVVALAAIRSSGSLPVALVITGLCLLGWVALDALAHRAIVRVLCDPAQMPLNRISSLPPVGESLGSRAL